jgi:16S rRNA (adenine1518-N6/adenine1519-N6)-dimethyltransferase
MPIYKPSELRLFLNQLEIFPKKGLSQNFLIDGNIIRKIVMASKVQSGDVVLEIGPGPGSLTQALLETGARVVAVEKDGVLAQALERLQTPSQQLSIFCHDILTFPLEKEISALLKKEEQKAKVIANLPYHLTTPILVQLIPLRHLFSSLTVMVQEEVARRLTAQPGSADYSSLTLFLRFYTEPHYAFTVSHNCFYPAPKVNSAIVVLQLREPPLSEDKRESFFQLTRTAFEHRRKMLRASLKNLFPPQKVEDALKAIGQNPLARPEILSLEEFLQLHALLSPFQLEQ